MENKRSVGRKYELLAFEYLQKKNYEILEQNFQNRYGEIDIIAKDGDILVFVEVKYRASNRYGDPLEAVHPAKQKKISRVAFGYYNSSIKAKGLSCRFDVIAVYGNERIVHIENAFDYTGTR